MPNMRLDKNPMPEQCPNVRNKNFLEVTTGYTEEMAIDEAQRCLNCKNKPCVTGCPVQIDIPAFIAEVAKGDIEKAFVGGIKKAAVKKYLTTASKSAFLYIRKMNCIHKLVYVQVCVQSIPDLNFCYSGCKSVFLAIAQLKKAIDFDMSSVFLRFSIFHRKTKREMIMYNTLCCIS